MNGNGVYVGCAVTAQGSPDMTLAVAAGLIRYAEKSAVVAAGNVTITTADATNPRIDLVVVSATGTKSVTAGTAAATPVAPAIPASSILLAVVYVPANDTAIGSAQIIDKRCILSSSLAVQVYKAADEIVNNSTTLQNDDDLKWDVDANSMWVFEFTLHASAINTTGDYKMAWTVPASATMRWGPIMNVSAANTFVGYHHDILSNGSQAPTVPLNEGTTHSFGSYNGTQQVKFWGMVFVAGTAGTIQLQWAQNFADANDSKFLKGSSIVARRLGT